MLPFKISAIWTNFFKCNEICKVTIGKCIFYINFCLENKQKSAFTGSSDTDNYEDSILENESPKQKYTHYKTDNDHITAGEQTLFQIFNMYCMPTVQKQ